MTGDCGLTRACLQAKSDLPALAVGRGDSVLRSVMANQLAVECRLHYDESLLAEKKNNVSVSSSLDPASMTMDLPDAALFSMDDPKISSIDPKLSAGGVMEVSLDDNMLLAEQHSSSKKMNSNSGSDVLDTKDKRKEGTEAGEDMGVPALDKAADISTTAEDKNRSQEESSVSVRTPPRNNVVPFRRQQVPRS